VTFFGTGGYSPCKQSMPKMLQKAKCRYEEFFLKMTKNLPKMGKKRWFSQKIQMQTYIR